MSVAQTGLLPEPCLIVDKRSKALRDSDCSDRFLFSFVFLGNHQMQNTILVLCLNVFAFYCFGKIERSLERLIAKFPPGVVTVVMLSVARSFRPDRQDIIVQRSVEIFFAHSRHGHFYLEIIIGFYNIYLGWGATLLSVVPSVEQSPRPGIVERKGKRVKFVLFY